MVVKSEMQKCKSKRKQKNSQELLWKNALAKTIKKVVVDKTQQKKAKVSGVKNKKQKKGQF